LGVAFRWDSGVVFRLDNGVYLALVFLIWSVGSNKKLKFQFSKAV